MALRQSAKAVNSPNHTKVLKSFEGGLKNWLAGEWGLQRRMRSPDGRLMGAAKGRLVIDGSRWLETGTVDMKLGPDETKEFGFNLEYRLSFGGGMTVMFKDGRHFFDVSGTASRAAINHLCGQDRYIGSIRFYSLSNRPPAFSLYWHVTGPRKNYRMLTLYTAQPSK